MGGTALNATKLKVFEWEMQRESTWTSCYFAEAISRLYKHEYKFSYEKDDPEAMQFLENLRSFLISEHAFLLRLLTMRTSSNRKLLLRNLAVFHLAKRFSAGNIEDGVHLVRLGWTVHASL